MANTSGKYSQYIKQEIFKMPIEINPELFYSKTEILDLLGIGASTFGEYKRRGLKTHKVGKEVYSQGKELIEYILAQKGGENCYSKACTDCSKMGKSCKGKKQACYKFTWKKDGEL